MVEATAMPVGSRVIAVRGPMIGTEGTVVIVVPAGDPWHGWSRISFDSAGLMLVRNDTLAPVTPVLIEVLSQLRRFAFTTAMLLEEARVEDVLRAAGILTTDDRDVMRTLQMDPRITGGI